MSEDRPLNPMQLAFHYLGELANPNSGEVITLDGYLDVSLLRSAIEQAVHRHPLLNCVPVLKFKKPYWRTHPSPLPIDLELRSTQDKDETSVLAGLCSNIWGQRLARSGRQVRFVYTCGPQRSYLQICAPHAITDAWSGTRLAADIALAYTALCEGKQLSTTAPRPLERSVAQVFLSKLSLFQRLGVIFETARRLLRDIFTRGGGLSLPSYRDNTPTKVAVTRVANDVLDNALHQARRHGVTVHSLFLLALTRARSEIVPGGDRQKFRINDFATLRPFADRDLADVFDVLVVPNQITIDPAWGDFDALRILSKRLKHQKNGGILPELYRLSLYGMLGRFLPTHLAAQLVFKLINKTDIAVTNPGRVPWQSDLDVFGEVPVLDFINFPQRLPPAKMVLIFTTFRGELRIIQLYDPSAIHESAETFIVKPFLHHLKRLTEQLSSREGPL
jgi:hypothetical protein